MLLILGFSYSSSEHYHGRYFSTSCTFRLLNMSRIRSKEKFSSIVAISLFALFGTFLLIYTRRPRHPQKSSSEMVDESLRHQAFLGSLRVLNNSDSKTAADMFEEAGFSFDSEAGQVSPESSYGKALRQVAFLKDVRVALETGTWDGSGSSLSIAKGLKESFGILYTIEALEEKWLKAERHLSDYPVKCLLGVGVDTSFFPKIDDVVSAGGVGDAPQDEWQKWHASEKSLADSYPVGLIKPICERFKVDFVHIDGGEFSGPNEYRSVRKHCKDVKFIALDDTKMYKNKSNYADLMADTAWQIFKENKEDRLGWAIFVHASWNSRQSSLNDNLVDIQR